MEERSEHINKSIQGLLGGNHFFRSFVCVCVCVHLTAVFISFWTIYPADNNNLIISTHNLFLPSPLLFHFKLFCVRHYLHLFRLYLYPQTEAFSFVPFHIHSFIPACPSLQSTPIVSRPPQSLHLFHSPSRRVSWHCSVFPQRLVTVADFVSVQWLIAMALSLWVCVCVCVGICLCERVCA